MSKTSSIQSAPPAPAVPPPGVVESPPHRRPQRFPLLMKLLKPLASLRLTVVLFLLSMVLVFCGTLAQVDDGIWVVLRPGHPIDVAAHLGDLDAEIASIGAERMTYLNALPEEPLATNWKSVTEGLLEGLHVPFVHAGTFATNPQALDLDLGYFDAVGPHVRWVLPIFTRPARRSMIAALPLR